MKIYIARDWFGTMCFITRPQWINNGNGECEWSGARVSKFEMLIPNNFNIEKGQIIEAEIVLALSSPTTIMTTEMFEGKI